MDVGNPSNFVRVQSAFEYDLKKIRKEISCYAVTDEETLLEIRNMYHHTAQIIDPHTAVGVHAAIHYSAQLKNNIPMIVTATAHHGKFPEVTEQALQQKFPEPPQLVDAQKKKKQSMLIAANYDLWKKLFLAL
jgi:threonine synthase